MGYASEDLINEHEGILFGIKILEIMTDLIKKNKKVDIDDIKNILEFLKMFADKCHHGKEENILFPEMEKAGVKKDEGPIRQMMLEHEQGRGYISEMAKSMRYGDFDKDGFIFAAKNYVKLIRAHIDKENTIIFPLANKIIPADKQTRLLKMFEEFEEEVMGKGTHEKLHELLENLEEKYF